MNKPELIVLVGLPGSGKTTWKEKQLWLNPEYSSVCPDDIRQELTGDISDQSKNNEVFSLAFIRTKNHLNTGQSVIFDSTAYSAQNRKALIDIGKSTGALVKAVVLSVPVDLCKKRNAQRLRTVPADVIDRMNSKFSIPSTDEGFDAVEIID